MNFRGWSLVGFGVGGGPDPKKKGFNRIHIYLQSMFILSFQSSVLGFGTKYT